MRWRIVTLGRTAVYVHAALPLTLLMAAAAGRGLDAAAAFASALLHEGAHTLAGKLLGAMPAEVELTPLGAVMRLEEEQRMPDGRRLLMLLAGPAMSFALCLLTLEGASAGWLRWHTARRFFMANAGILMINLLPALPLDGGRMIALLLGRMMNAATVRRVMRSAGLLLGVAAIAVNGWAAIARGVRNVSLAVVGCFLISGTSAASANAAMEQLRRLMDKKIRLERKGSMPGDVTLVMADEPLGRQLADGRMNRIRLAMVMERGTMKTLGMVTEFEAVSLWLNEPSACWRDCLHVDECG